MSHGLVDIVKRMRGIVQLYVCSGSCLSCICASNRLFFGCHHYTGSQYETLPLNISSIRMITTAKNYQAVIQTITAFDSIISDNADEDLARNIPSSAAAIMAQLLSNEAHNGHDPFIYRTFKLFLAKKTSIKIDMNKLCFFDASFLKSIFGGTGVQSFVHSGNEIKSYLETAKIVNELGYELNSGHIPSKEYFIPQDKTNIIRFDVFDNLEDITIYNVPYGSKSAVQFFGICRKRDFEKGKLNVQHKERLFKALDVSLSIYDTLTNIAIAINCFPCQSYHIIRTECWFYQVI